MEAPRGLAVALAFSSYFLRKAELTAITSSRFVSHRLACLETGSETRRVTVGSLERRAFSATNSCEACSTKSPRKGASEP